MRNAPGSDPPPTPAVPGAATTACVVGTVAVHTSVPIASTTATTAPISR